MPFAAQNYNVSGKKGLLWLLDKKAPHPDILSLSNINFLYIERQTNSSFTATVSIAENYFPETFGISILTKNTFSPFWDSIGSVK